MWCVLFVSILSARQFPQSTYIIGGEDKLCQCTVVRIERITRISDDLTGEYHASRHSSIASAIPTVDGGGVLSANRRWMRLCLLCKHIRKELLNILHNYVYSRYHPGSCRVDRVCPVQPTNKQTKSLVPRLSPSFSCQHC